MSESDGTCSRCGDWCNTRTECELGERAKRAEARVAELDEYGKEQYLRAERAEAALAAGGEGRDE